MPCSNDDYLKFARAVNSASALPLGEIRHRVVASRAYYSAYLATRDAHNIKHLKPPESIVYHDVLSRTMAEDKNDTAVREYGTLLDSLRNVRVHADYHQKRPFDDDLADDSIMDAEKLIATLPAIKDRIPRVA